MSNGPGTPGAVVFWDESPNLESIAVGRNKKKLAVAVLIGVVGRGLVGIGRRRARTNLLLVTIDTLRADHVGAYGDTQAVTPSLDGLAGARRPLRARPEPGALTGPSHATILTGLYPPRHGVRDNVVFTLDPRHLTLATLLKAQGYCTAACRGVPRSGRVLASGKGSMRSARTSRES